MKIALLGDMAFFGRMTINNSSYKKMFAPIKEHLQGCDYIIGNLESPLTTQNKVVGGKSAYLKGKPNDVEILSYLGVTHVTLANNHMFDYKAQGMADTIRVLEENKIAWYGANSHTETICFDNNKIVLIGYCCYSTNGKGLGTETPCVNVFDPRKAEESVDKYINEGYLPILSIHWGQEHVHYPNYDHIEVARKLCKNRKIVIHGHHPHVIQGIETVNKSLIAYSLGNFCFDDVYTKKSNKPLVKLSTDNQESFVLIVNVENNEITGYEIVPFSFEGGQYQIKEDIMRKIQIWSDFLNTSKETYIQQRTKDLSSYIDKRKELRNLEWYLKRINVESIKMILGSRQNIKKYNTLVKRYIK